MLNTSEKIIKHKTGLLNLAEELGNMSKAYQIMGLSRDTFYRYKAAVEKGGVEALFERTRRKPNLANRVDPSTEEAVVKFATDFPAYGQARTSNELSKLGVFVSPSGVRSIWLRHDLANFKARLKALEVKVAEESIILTEAQVQALEKKKQDDEACGEIETAHPGYLESQDTFYVGTLKGVGCVYQQTYVDTYCKVAHAKLYTTKTPITAADLLNDHVLPFHDEHGFPVLRIMTDRGTEYCGHADKHDYQIFLAINDIDHTKTKVKSLQTNGICEWFHKTIVQEFYQVTFRKKLYDSIDTLQADLDDWLQDNSLENVPWKTLQPAKPLLLLVPRDEILATEYEYGWKMTDIMPINSTGVVTARDKLVFDFTKDEIVKKFKRFVDPEISDERYTVVFFSLT